MEHRNIRGFTIIEAMITMLVLAVLVGLALPSLTRLLSVNRLTGQSNDLTSAVNLARNEAITRSNTVRICPSSNGTACSSGSWNTGWLIFDDSDGDNGLDAGEAIIRAYNTQSVMRLTASSVDGFSFNERGSAAGASSNTVRICFNDTSVLDECRRITIGPSGAISVEKVDAPSS